MIYITNLSYFTIVNFFFYVCICYIYCMYLHFFLFFTSSSSFHWVRILWWVDKYNLYILIDQQQPVTKGQLVSLIYFYNLYYKSVGSDMWLSINDFNRTEKKSHRPFNANKWLNLVNSCNFGAVMFSCYLTGLLAVKKEWPLINELHKPWDIYCRRFAPNCVNFVNENAKSWDDWETYFI